MTGDTLVLKTVFDHWGHTQALRDGTVKPSGIAFDYVEISPTHRAFKPMAERLEFDLCEMAITTYVLARAFDKQFTALPVVLSRNFHHGSIVYNAKSGIKEPKDLEGKRVGVRAYSQTTGVWVRGILQSEYGADSSKMTWVTFEGAHVSEYKDPENVVRAAEGKKIEDMLLSGEIDAAVGSFKLDSPDIKKLFPDPNAAALEWFNKTKVYPINHLVVVKNSIVEANPWVLGELYYGFKAAKDIYVERLRKEGASSPADELRVRLMKMVGGDPLPYGVEKNRKAMETAVRFAYEQKLLPRPYSVEEMFLPAVMELD